MSGKTKPGAGHSRTPGASRGGTQDKKDGDSSKKKNTRPNSIDENPYEEQKKDSNVSSQIDKAETNNISSQKEKILESVAREDNLEDKDYSYKNVANIWDGKIFGELALISHKPRAATI